jgi:hypothetical protein
VNNNISAALDKIKELVSKGNVSRIVVRKDDKDIINIPVTVGVVGAVVGVTAAKWAMLAAVLATVGFGCTVEIIKNDGEIVNVLSEEDSQKIHDKAADIMDDVKGAIDETFKKDVKAEEPKAEEPTDEEPRDE